MAEIGKGERRAIVERAIDEGLAEYVRRAVDFDFLNGESVVVASGKFEAALRRGLEMHAAFKARADEVMK